MFLNRGPVFPGKTGPCRSTPFHRYGAFLSCAVEEKDEEEGNYIDYRIRDDGNTFEMEMVNGEYCKPKQEACRCSKMLDFLLETFPKSTL